MLQHLWLGVLLSMLRTPYKAVSKPMLEAWARLSRKFGLRAAWRFAMSEAGNTVIPGATPTADEAQTELREKAAAKFKEANDFATECAEAAGKTYEALTTGEYELSAEELAKFNGFMVEAKALDAQYMKVRTANDTFGDTRARMDWYYSKATGGGPLPWNQVNVQTIERPKSLGEEVVTSAEYKALVDSGTLKSQNSPLAPVRLLEGKLYEGFEEMKAEASKAATDVIHTESGGPGNSLVLPDYLARILGLPQRPLTVRELFFPGNTTSDTLSYARQTGFDNAAAAVAQATTVSNGAKPQSSIGWERVTSPIETIATWMVATRQQLADAGMTAMLIDNQGRLMLQLEEEDQLLSGNGSSPNLDGILNVTGVQTLSVNAGGDNLDAIRTAKRMTRTGLSRLASDAVVLNPYDNEQYDLLKDANGQYRGGNPIGNFNEMQSMWQLRRVESEGMPQGHALVGAFKAGAAVVERQGITVLTTDSHADFFVRNLIVVLFEERLGFPVFFPTAFVDVTLDQTDWGT